LQTATAAFGTIAAGNDATVMLKVTITWPAAVPAAYQTLAELSVLSCRPTRDTQTDMPDGTRYVTGRASSSCDITLAGLVDATDVNKSIAWLVGQFSATSPMYRQTALTLPVTVDMGVMTGDATKTTPDFEGVEFVRVFTGIIDDYATNSDGTVTFTCLDRPSNLDGAATLPSFASNSSGVYNVGNATYAYGSLPQLSAGWVLNYLLFQAGMYVAPPPRSGCVFYGSMHGSAWPEVGLPEITANATLANPSATLAGKWSQEVLNVQASDSINVMAGTNPIRLCTVSGLFPTQTYFFFEGWVKIPATGSADITSWSLIATTGGVSQDFLTFTLKGSAAGLSVRANVKYNLASTSFTSTSVTTTAGWRQISIQAYYDFSSSPSYTTAVIPTVWIDGAASGMSFGLRNVVGTVNPDALAGNFSATIAQVIGNVPVEAMQIDYGTTALTPVTGFVSNAGTVQQSLNQLTATVDVAGQSRWDVIQALAAAELGVAGQDENGVFFFRNRKAIQNTAAVRTITQGSSLVNASYLTARASATINHVQVPVNKLQVGKAGVVWSAADVITVPNAGTYVQTITTQDPVVGLAVTDSGEMPSGGGTAGNTYWRACKAANGAGTRVTTGITITVVQTSPTQIQMTIKNTNLFPVYMVTPIGVGFPSDQNGQPCVSIGGQVITAAATAADGSTSTSAAVTADATWNVTPANESLLALSANPWRQNVDICQQLALDVLSDMNGTKPLLQGVRIVADPRLQRGDRVTLEVADGVFQDAIIQNIVVEDDWTMTVDLRATSSPGAWLLGVVGSSELGVTTFI
jgi:hypothetical protein